MKIDGVCPCGRITYEVDIDPETGAICHCTDCLADVKRLEKQSI
jgi:hypothetical protein